VSPAIATTASSTSGTPVGACAAMSPGPSSASVRHDSPPVSPSSAGSRPNVLAK
jgi:hypothetical protein